MNLVVAGIGTDVGKSIVSAILCEALCADYWKPVQAGDLDSSDTDKVKSLISYPAFKIHPETHRLVHPMSPHAAADREGIQINRSDFKKPNTNGRSLVTELAGGLMVPLSENYLTVDLAADLNDPIVLVANYYLGSINHTLLALELIAQRNLNLAGLIFNGQPNLQSRDVILNYSEAPLIAEIPLAENLDRTFVKTHANDIRNHPRLA